MAALPCVWLLARNRCMVHMLLCYLTYAAHAYSCLVDLDATGVGYVDVVNSSLLWWYVNSCAVHGSPGAHLSTVYVICMHASAVLPTLGSREISMPSKLNIWKLVVAVKSPRRMSPLSHTVK